VLHAGEVACRAGDLLAAEVLLDRLIAAGMLVGWAQFFRGRCARERGREDEALARYEAALAAEPDLFWAAYERLVILRRRDIDLAELSRGGAALLVPAWEPLSPPHVRELEALAHHLWDRGEREAARGLLARLTAAGDLFPLGRARVGLEPDPAAEAAVLDAASDGMLALEAEPMLTARLALLPSDTGTSLSLAAVRARGGEAGAAVQAVSELPEGPARSLGRLLATIGTGDAEGGHAGLVEHVRLYGRCPRVPALALTAMLVRAGDGEARDEVLGLLRAFHADDADVGLATARAMLADGDWQDAEDLLARRFSDPCVRTPAVRALAAELAAARGDLVRALGTAAGDDHALLPTRLRLLGELGRWDDALDAVLPRLAGEDRYEGVLAPAVRAARRAGRSGALMTALVAAGGGRGPGPLTDALAAVAADLPARAGEIAGAPLTSDQRARLPAAPVAAGLCVYTAADAAYLLPALVTLASAAVSNARLMRSADVRLVAAPDALTAARWMGGALAERLGLRLTVEDGGALATAGLRTGYGLVTGGERLAEAAYYRIFLARQLMHEGRHDRALYLDADVVVRPGLGDLFTGVSEAPLRARPEPGGAAVARAAAALGLTGRYFNSGVLAFRLDHPELEGALERSLAAAADPAVPLMFHDQCALNIGFDRLADPLPRRFNHYVRAEGATEPDEGNAVVVHYLDRPKPWDGLYRGPAREWLGWREFVVEAVQERA